MQQQREVEIESRTDVAGRHIRALDRRPPSHVPFFNGNLFKQHFSEELLLGDTWLAEFIGELSDDESPYLFNVIPVEILGSVYERFLGKVVRPHGRGVTIEEKPEVRKAGGVYYTPRYIVDYIVEQTVGRQLDAVAGIPLPGRVGVPPAASGVAPEVSSESTPKALRKKFRQDAETGGQDAHPTRDAFERATRALRILDPACGSGSLLIRAFERVCEHWQRRFTLHPADSMDAKAWTLLSADEALLQNKMKAAGKRLLDLPADMSRGSSTGDDETFVVEPLGHSYEAGCLRTPLFASDFGRYSFAPEGKWQVIFPYACEAGHARLREQSECRKLFPNAYAHLQANAARLRVRKQFKEWHGYSAPRNLDLHDRAQIAVPLLANRGLFALIPPTYRGKLCPMASGGFTIALGEDCPFRPEFILGILNSTLMFWFLGRISNVFRGGWITCTKQYFGELPIRSLDLSLSTDRARHDALVSLVEKMLALVPKLRAETRERAVLANAVETTDRKIDDIVHALDGLTAEELAELVDWAENALLDGEFADEEMSALGAVVSRLGVADVRAFGLTWEDCEALLHELGYSARVDVVAV